MTPQEGNELRYHIDELEKQVESLMAFKKSIEDRDQKRLVTAVYVLGGAVIVMAGFVWWELAWPAIKNSLNVKGK